MGEAAGFGGIHGADGHAAGDAGEVDLERAGLVEDGQLGAEGDKAVVVVFLEDGRDSARGRLGDGGAVGVGGALEGVG